MKFDGSASATSAVPDKDLVEAAVSARGVTMRYGAVRAVDNASFELAAGRFLTILGPSGSGKTTLLRMIAGFERPTEGTICIGGVPVDRTPPHRRSIGMVFQRLALFPHMTADENVAFPLRMRRFDARTIPERVERYLDLVRLRGMGARRIGQLSGGQQQRVAIARALVFEPDLLLLDEPLAALDRKLREEMQLEFRRIQRELGVTTINVTHDQREALVVSDDVIVMNEGRIQQWARPTDTYRSPSNAFVAGFIGVTNFLTGVVITSGERVAFAPDDEGPFVGAWAGQGATPAPGTRVAGALRAEQIRIARDDTTLASLDTVRRGTVTDAIFEGERVVYEVAVAGLDDRLRVFDHNPASHEALAMEDEVALGWNAGDVLVFAA